MPDRQKNALREKMAVREIKKLKNSQKKALKKEKKLEKASRPGRLFPILAAVLILGILLSDVAGDMDETNLGALEG